MIVILSLGGNPDRLNPSVTLCEVNPGSHLIVSSESPIDKVLDKLNTSSLTSDRYTIDESAWDTVTNFTNTMPLVKSLNPEELWVVTDGYHIPRAMCVGEIVYFQSGIKLKAYPSSQGGRHESKRLILTDSIRAAISRFFGNTVYNQQVYNDRIALYYNDYYSARQAGAPVSPK